MKNPLSKHLQVGDKFYFPSNEGMALLCEVLGKTPNDIVVYSPLDSREKIYIPNDRIDSHALPLDKTKAKVYVTQKIEDPDNQIVYLRYKYNETWIDKLYNLYCSKKKRGDTFTL